MAAGLVAKGGVGSWIRAWGTVRCEWTWEVRTWTQRMKTEFEGEERSGVVEGGRPCNPEKDFVICVGREGLECPNTSGNGPVEGSR